MAMRQNESSGVWRNIPFPSCCLRGWRLTAAHKVRVLAKGYSKTPCIERHKPDIAGIRALLVHAKDEDARRFYAHFNFDPSPIAIHITSSLLVKDIRKIIGH